MPKYRKKPVIVEAFKWNGEDPTMVEKDSPCWPKWFWDKWKTGKVSFFPNNFGNGSQPSLVISTLEGMHRVDSGCVIIQGVKGEIYSCKPDIFALTYEEVTDAL